MKLCSLKYILRDLKYRYLPFIGAGWSPRSRAVRMGCIIDDCHYSEVFASAPSGFDSLSSITGTESEFVSGPVVRYPSVGIYSLKNASVCFSIGTILSSSGQVVTACSWFSGAEDEMRLESNPLKISPVELSGLSISLASDFAGGNYGHFLLDGLGRLAIISRYQENYLDSCERVFVSGPEEGWKTRLIKRFGIPIEKVFWLSGSVRYRCEELMATSFPGFRRSYPSWLCEYFRTTVPFEENVDNSAGRRLFLSRKSTNRRLQNESSLIAIAKEYGFCEYLPEGAKDPIADFRKAEVVIGAHGAGLTDIVFMAAEAKVLELMPDDHRHCYFYTLGISSGLKYMILLGESAGDRGKNPLGPSPFNFSVDEIKFRRSIESLLS